MPAERDPSGEKTNRVLLNATATIELLAQQGSVGPPELAQVLGIPRPSAYRLLSALVHAGFAKQDDDGSVSISNRWLRLGDLALAGVSAWFRSPARLEEVRQATGLTVYLAVARGFDALCIRRLPGRDFQVLVLKPGGSLPWHLGAVGRTILAYSPAGPEAYLERAPFHPVTPGTLVTAEELRDDAARTRRMGFCLSDEDVTIGVAALGVPILRDGRLLGSLSVAGIRDELVDRQEGLAAQLTRAAAGIADEAQ